MFGATYASGPDAASVPGWQIALAFLGGAIAPYVVAFGWVILVAPPDVREMFRQWRERRAAGRGKE
ncbi:hypothetical protein [Hydrogenophaga sp. 5NK40-0174]|uniref:hypothetical protein n=1 Tax=Hydrogenophaga sp. 5NK40-0174 TaxID=3127649 RepID=UPI0031095D62